MKFEVRYSIQGKTTTFLECDTQKEALAQAKKLCDNYRLIESVWVDEVNRKQLEVLRSPGSKPNSKTMKDAAGPMQSVMAVKKRQKTTPKKK